MGTLRLTSCLLVPSRPNMRARRCSTSSCSCGTISCFMSKGLESDGTYVFRSTRRHPCASLATHEHVSEIPVNTASLDFAAFFSRADTGLTYSRPSPDMVKVAVASVVKSEVDMSKEEASAAKRLKLSTEAASGGSTSNTYTGASDRLVAFYLHAQDRQSPVEALQPWPQFVASPFARGIEAYVAYSTRK